MTTMLNDEVADLRRANAELQQRLDEALAREAASAEVLQVINSSTGDLAPVFEAMLEKAMRLCEAAFGGLGTWQGDRFAWVASRGLPQPFAEYIATNEVSVGPRAGFARIAHGDGYVQFADIWNSKFYRGGESYTRAIVDLGRARTTLSVPLVKDDAVLGILGFFRQEVRPFSEKQIALVKNFAAQAVIAMENARLLEELRQRTGDLQESLEYQTAISDLLKVISRSTFDLQPVLDTLVETAARLCSSDMAHLFTREDEAYRAVASFAHSPEFDSFIRERSFLPERGTVAGRTVLDGQIVHIADLVMDPEFALPEAVVIGKIRTVIGVPLLRRGEPIGVITLSRQRVEPFTERQIELVRTFADQAVIAMENARLITETQEALEQQTATAEVLQVINASPGNLAPVFDAMIEKAMDLCGVAFGALVTYRDGCFHVGAVRGPREVEEWAAEIGPIVPEPGSAMLRLVQGEDVAQVVDAANDDNYRLGGPVRKAMVDIGGYRTLLAVSLRKHDALLGALYMYRQEVRPFTEKQIALLQNFAAQAVIAMENARLITETREALEQQTATAEVLQVINSSPGDLAPVFDAILEKAHALCGATHGALGTYDDDHYFRSVVARGYPQVLAERLQQGFDGLTNPVTRPLIDGAPFVHIPDLAEIDHPIPQAVANLGGFHTGLFLPLRKDDRLLGHISATRSEVRPFAEKEIALLQNFAAQAVIAMENARLITETREALEQQTATAEVLQVINSSPGDLTPVFDAMLEKAMRLCGAAFGVFAIYGEDHYRVVATHGVPLALGEFVRQAVRIRPGSIPDRVRRGEATIQVPDITALGSELRTPGLVAMIELGNARTAVWVALRKDGVAQGFFGVYRQEVRPFTEKQIALLENFAAQAVIAIENARLITELRQRTHDLQESLEYQTATSDVLKVVSRSTFDLQPVLNTLVNTAARLCSADLGHLSLRDGQVYRVAASFAFSDEWDAFIRRQTLTAGRGSVVGRSLLEARAVHIDDITADPEYSVPEAITIGNIRTLVGVPLLRENEPIGVFAFGRSRVDPFTERQIALVSTFADQAVIAIENARLFNELRQRTPFQGTVGEGPESALLARCGAFRRWSPF